MDEFINAIDNLPFWIKVLFCIPALDMIWALYRIVKGAATGNTLMVVVGVLWIIPGAFFCWIIDIVTTLMYGQPKFFA